MSSRLDKRLGTNGPKIYFGIKNTVFRLSSEQCDEIGQFVKVLGAIFLQKNLIHKGQCLCVCLGVCVSVCVGVLYRNPNGWTDRDEIWHRGGPRVGEVS